jgi:hypothetical protein
MTFGILALALLAAAGVRAGEEAEARCRTPALPVCDKQLEQPPPPKPSTAAEKEADLAVSPLRKAIIAAAAGEIGKVSELPGPDCNKLGWRSLIGYHERSLGRTLEEKERRTLKRARWKKETKTKVQDWCGIFALWSVKEGLRARYGDTALDCDAAKAPKRENPAKPDVKLPDLRGIYLGATRWTIQGGGGGIDGLPYVAGSKGLKPGDIVTFSGELNHHAIVERVVGRDIYTIDGNMGCQMVVRAKRPVSEISGYYPVE